VPSTTRIRFNADLEILSARDGRARQPGHEDVYVKYPTPKDFAYAIRKILEQDIRRRASFGTRQSPSWARSKKIVEEIRRRSAPHDGNSF